MSEAQIQAGIVRWLKQQPEIWIFKVHGGGWGRRGVPDILVCHQGRMVGMEVKGSQKAKPSESQELEIYRINLAGGVAGVVRSVDDARQLLEKASMQAAAYEAVCQA